MDTDSHGWERDKTDCPQKDAELRRKTPRVNRAVGNMDLQDGMNGREEAQKAQKGNRIFYHEKGDQYAKGKLKLIGRGISNHGWSRIHTDSHGWRREKATIFLPRNTRNTRKGKRKEFDRM
jgi:hypothetical protein